jgi:ABC-2 type transport system ATP-binding protein
LANSPSPAITVEHLVKRYGGRPVVDDLSFSVGPGEIFALLGPNGAGKTTTIEILEGYRTADGGRVRVLGLQPGRDNAELHRRVGLMLQQGGFYPTTTPREAIHLYAGFFDNPADPEELLRRVGLENAARTRYRRLSGGQKQRLSLAVALVGQPALVFLDEPTAGMDPQARHATWEIIRELKNGGVSVVVTTHLIDEAERIADRVGIIDQGKLIALGSPAELTAGPDHELVTLTVPPKSDLSGIECLASVSGVQQNAPGTLVIDTTSPPDLLVDLTLWLRERKIVPRAMRVGGETLEDVFLRLTGKALRE